MQFISRTFQYLLIVPLVLPEQGDMSLFFVGFRIFLPLPIGTSVISSCETNHPQTWLFKTTMMCYFSGFCGSCAGCCLGTPTVFAASSPPVGETRFLTGWSHHSTAGGQGGSCKASESLALEVSYVTPAACSLPVQFTNPAQVQGKGT